ncbi:MAG: PAS domain-containing protein, partial [Gemmatimonadales bacterium]
MDSIAVESETLTTDQRVRLVDDASRAIEAAVDLEAVPGVTLGALVPKLADLAVLLLEGAPPGSHLEVAHVRSGLVPVLRRRVTDGLDAIREAARVNGREGCYARWVPSLNDHALRFLTRGDGGLGNLLRSFGVRSLIVVALRAGGRTIGALALARSDNTEPFHAADYAAVQVLGRRLALALESAMLRQSLDAEFDPRSRVREAVNKWIRVFDLAVWGAAVVDGMDRRIDAVNPAFARMHRYPEPSSLTGRHFADLLPPDRAREMDDWGTGAENGAYESVHIRLDGTTMPVLVSVTPLDDAGQGGSYVVTVQELTDLKRTEERLQRAQRMEAVGRLAGGVAHEVNNMMTIILGFSDLLSRDLSAAGHRDQDDRQREVEEIRKAAVRAARITTQLLAFSRQQVLQPTELRLSQVVEEMVPVLRLMLPANVRVETTFAPSPAVVRADRSQLEQVLINLAFNARDAMAAGGTIRLVTESRRLDEAAGRRLIGIPIPAGRYGLISVVDTGHGMDRATVTQVFEPFFTTKPAGSGTGLGLSTVYG